MSDLVTRLEAAPEGSRELSDEVLLALGWTEPLVHGVRMLRDPAGTHYYSSRPAPSPAESVDDGLALLREMGLSERDAYFSTSNRGRDDWEHWTLWQARINIETPEEDPDETSGVWNGFAATLALALSAALVRAADAIRRHKPSTH